MKIDSGSIITTVDGVNVRFVRERVKRKMSVSQRFVLVVIEIKDESSISGALVLI